MDAYKQHLVWRESEELATPLGGIPAPISIDSEKAWSIIVRNYGDAFVVGQYHVRWRVSINSY